MAESKDWTTNGATVADHVIYPCNTRYFAGGDASNWCVHTAPGYAIAVTVTNRGTGILYVALGPHLSGAAAATQHCEQLGAGESRLFVLAGPAPEPNEVTKFSTWGADGAAHVMRLVFEAEP